MKKLNYFITITSILSTTSLFAMGSKRPSSSNSTTPATVPSVKIPAPTINLGAQLLATDFLDSASMIGSRVDAYKKQSELIENRTLINNDQTDKCFNADQEPQSFAENVSYYVSKMFDDTNAYVGVIGSYYGTSANDNNYFPVSLIRHPLCLVTTQSLTTTIGKVPDNTTINRINHFSTTMNTLRKETIEGNSKSKKEMLNLWTTFYSCLAYTESLSSADSQKSYSVASKYAPQNYRKPSGVEFYEDPAQSQDSKLNIGMYQFTPNSGNNIQSCLRAWNKFHQDKPQCQQNLKGSQAEMILATGSSLQSFNAFCGIHKMIQTFSIQVNTTTASATHPSNMVNGKLKPFEDRCVSPHFKAGKAYVHFGPFMNSTGSNLSELFSCIENNGY
jgi:hypothetical protein